METYLGIDGGGSKTRALLVDAKGCKLHYAESGPSNLNAYGDDIVRTSLSDVYHQCIKVTNTVPTASCFGLAGAGNTITREKLKVIIEKFCPQDSTITSDAAIALEGAFGGGPGILLIAGTGSVCLGKSSDGKVVQTGGWGWLADDAGSAGWIGQRALEIALQQNDGRIDGRAVRDAVFIQLGISTSEEISPKLYQPLLGRYEIAALSHCVLELAQSGDDTAQHIYQCALDELEKLVRATANKLGNNKPALVLTGGLLAHNPGFQRDLISRLSEFDIQKSQMTALEGAVALARRG